MQNERKEMISSIFRSHDLSALIFWRPDELVLMLGYLPLWGISVLVYTQDHEPVLFVPELEPKDLLPDNISIRIFPWGLIDVADPWSNLYAEIRDVLKQKNLLQKPVSFIESIGGTAPCRMSAEQPPLPADFTERLREVSEAGFRSITSNLINLYQYKALSDFKGLTLAHQVAAVAVCVFYRKIGVGTTEAKLAALIECAVQEMIGQNQISFAKAWPMVQSGENTKNGGRYNLSTGKPIASGELVLLEMAICVNGYWVDITRTAICGEPNNAQLKIYETVSKAQQIALKMLRPGVMMKEVDKASRMYIEKEGYGKYFNHALGHQVGFRYHDPGAGLSPGCTETLLEGMVLTVEPGIYGNELNMGVRIEDNVLITKNGYHLLSDYPRSLTGD